MYVTWVRYHSFKATKKRHKECIDSCSHPELLIACEKVASLAGFGLVQPRHSCLVGTGRGNGRWAVLVLDSTAARAASLNRADNLVRLDIAVGNAAKNDVLAVKP
jgi:hypothetical protein